MKTLFLLRHAKSAYPEGVGDRNRPLGPRGRRAAPAMADWMRGESLVPDRVLCSPALRTRETWAQVAPRLGRDFLLELREELYEAQPDGIVSVIQETGDDVATLLVIGHNPTLQTLALRLAGVPLDEGEAERRRRLKEKFPTAALAVLELPVDHWEDVRPGLGTLKRVVRPKDLPEAKVRKL